ncbi:MAG TPA: isochorismatase family cysteine hydrolase [Acidimicrobiales bacterium]|nr:isochorismatase family cysteine hydrolase [Acidimicrobiales bacterium]
MLVEADPYPWPYDGALVTERLALVICGAQRWFHERTAQPDDALDRVALVASLLRPMGTSILAVRHGSDHSHQTRPVLPAIGSTGYELIIDPSAADAVIDAAGMDAFYGSNLDAHLRARGLDTLILVGLGLEGPIHSTMRAANDRGYECLLISDASAPHEPSLVRAALSSIAFSGGIFGAFASTAAVVGACAGSTPSPSYSGALP